MMSFRFDGVEVPFTPGQTVAGALLAANVLTLRSTRVAKRPRGVFCGIGICHDCLVVASGSPNVRACLLPAAESLDVVTQDGTGHDDLGV